MNSPAALGHQSPKNKTSPYLGPKREQWKKSHILLQLRSTHLHSLSGGQSVLVTLPGLSSLPTGGQASAFIARPSPFSGYMAPPVRPTQEFLITSKQFPQQFPHWGSFLPMHLFIPSDLKGSYLTGTWPCSCILWSVPINKGETPHYRGPSVCSEVSLICSERDGSPGWASLID